VLGPIRWDFAKFHFQKLIPKHPLDGKLYFAVLCDCLQVVEDAAFFWAKETIVL
jgi:hypothetical protein